MDLPWILDRGPFRVDAGQCGHGLQRLSKVRHRNFSRWSVIVELIRVKFVCWRLRFAVDGSSVGALPREGGPCPADARFKKSISKVGIVL